MADVRIDVRKLDELARALKAGGLKMDDALKAGLKSAGDVVALDAKRRIAGASSRIGGTIRVRRRGYTVAVAAGGARAPHAPAFEHDGETGSFRHPVFGNFDVWVSQPAHPFLRPAAEAKGNEMTRAVIGVVDQSLSRLGL